MNFDKNIIFVKKMKNTSIFALSAILIIFFSSCEKLQDDPTPSPSRTPTLPEIVETELSDILTRNWTQLADTLEYFNTNLLSKGKFKGKGPDGVYYELDVDLGIVSKTKAKFIVKDSVWASYTGRLVPLDITVNACNTELCIKYTNDSTTISVDNVSARVPLTFITEEGQTSPLLYKDARVGYLTMEEFENPDYDTAKSLVLHYYNDTRTFSFYDTGLVDFITNGQEDL